jgi:DNA-binding NarL/FixJ family response regulator
MKQEPTAEILAALRRIRGALLAKRSGDTVAPLPPQSVIPRLTKREQEVLLLVKSGLPSKSIARRLNISDKTVDVHKHQLRRKLKLRTDLDLARHAALFVPDGAGTAPLRAGAPKRVLRSSGLRGGRR